MLRQRMIRAALFDLELYKEIKRRRTLNREAVQVIGWVSLANGMAFFLATLIGQHSFGRALLGLLTGFLSGLLSWLLLSFICYVVGTSIFGRKTNYERALRILGFALAPRVLRLLGFIPVLGWPVSLVVWFWSMATSVVAIQEALDVEIGPAIFVGATGWAGVVGLSYLLAAIAGLSPILRNMPF